MLLKAINDIYVIRVNLISSQPKLFQQIIFIRTKTPALWRPTLILKQDDMNAMTSELRHNQN